MKRPATELIHGGPVDPGGVTPLTTPIYETTTFVFERASDVVAYNEGRLRAHLYTRYSNPTVVSLEQRLATLDRAERALVFGSGMGATTTTMLAHARTGDEIV